MSRTKVCCLFLATALILICAVPVAADQTAPKACRVVKTRVDNQVAQMQRKCPAGWRWAPLLRRCVRMAGRRCDPRHIWNPVLRRCMLPHCKLGYYWNYQLHRCVRQVARRRCPRVTSGTSG